MPPRSPPLKGSRITHRIEAIGDRILDADVHGWDDLLRES